MMEDISIARVMPTVKSFRCDYLMQQRDLSLSSTGGDSRDRSLEVELWTTFMFKVRLLLRVRFVCTRVTNHAGRLPWQGQRLHL